MLNIECLEGTVTAAIAPSRQGKGLSPGQGLAQPPHHDFLLQIQPKCGFMLIFWRGGKGGGKKKKKGKKNWDKFWRERDDAGPSTHWVGGNPGATPRVQRFKAKKRELGANAALTVDFAKQRAAPPGWSRRFPGRTPPSPNPCGSAEGPWQQLLSWAASQPRGAGGWGVGGRPGSAVCVSNERKKKETKKKKK